MNAVLEAIVGRHVALTGVAAFGGWLSGSFGPGGVLLGGGVMLLTLGAYGVALGVVLRRASRRLAITLLFGKFLAFLGLGWMALGGMSGAFDPLGFAVGVTCFPVATFWGAARTRGTDGTF